MPVKAFLNSRFTTTAENQIFDDLIFRLNQRWADSEELVILLGNFYCEGSEIDAMIVKNDSISVIDFKNYGGRIEFSENDKWKADGTVIKGGNKRNPYIQIRTNKFTVLDYLKNSKGIFNDGHEINLGYISGIALFHKPIQFESQNMPTRISSWFHISDINNITQLIHQISSRGIDLSDTEILNIARALKLEEYFSDINSLNIKSVANSYFEENISIIHTPSQVNAIREVKEFIKNPEDKVLCIVGSVNSGKTFLIKDFINIIQSEHRNYELLAPSKRISDILTKREHKSFTSIYSKIYSGSPHKEKEIVKIDDEEYNLFRFFLGTNNDANDTIYIIDEAQLISDNFSKLDFFIFGSGKLLSDLIKYTQVETTNRKIILLGDDKQIINGNREQYALSTPYIETQLKIKKKQIELCEIVKSSGVENILENAISIRNSIVKETFNYLELIEDDEIVHKIDKTNFRNHYEKELAANPLNTIIIRSSNKQVAEMNTWVRRNVFNRKNNIDIGDFILLYNNIRVSSSLEYPDERAISNGEFGRITWVSSTVEEPLLQFYPNGFMLKGRSNPTCLKYREVGINFISLNKEVRVKISEDFLLSESVDTNPDEFIALMTLFSKRNPTLKKNSDEFVHAIRNDQYINAAKIKFGYTITGHKAQGYKWNNIFVDFETNGGKNNETYFRWSYTSLTRATSKLFLINTPFISPFSNIEWKENMSEIVEEKKKIFHYDSNIKLTDDLINEISIHNFPPDKPLLKSFFANTKHVVAILGCKISSVSHKGYEEHYEFLRNEERAIIKFNYNGQYKFTAYSIIKSTPKELGELIIEKLYSVNNENEINELSLNSKLFLTDLFDRLNGLLEHRCIKISHVESRPFLELYTFTRETEKVIVNFWYDGDGFFTTVMGHSTNSDKLLEEIKQIILQLKQL